MQDHEDFILFKQRASILIDSMQEKLNVIDLKIQKLEDKIEGSEHALLELQNELKLIDTAVKNISKSLDNLSNYIDKKEEEIKISNEDELDVLNGKVEEILNKPFKSFENKKELIIKTTITTTVSIITSAIVVFIMSNLAV